MINWFLGAINPNRDKSVIAQNNSSGIIIEVSSNEIFIKALPLTVFKGTSQPQTARRLLQEGACLGMNAFIFFNTEKDECLL